MLLGGVLVGLAGCSGDSGSVADRDAQASCDTLQRMGTLSFSKKNPTMDELNAAAELATAAAIGDSRYKPLKKYLRTAVDATKQTFKPDSHRTVQNLKKAKDFCSDL